LFWELNLAGNIGSVKQVAIIDFSVNFHVIRAVAKSVLLAITNKYATAIYDVPI